MSEVPPTAKILFVEDEEPVLKSLLKFFKKQGFEAYGAQTSEEALNITQQKMPDIAVLDVMLHEGPDGKGLLMDLRFAEKCEKRVMNVLSYSLPHDPQRKINYWDLKLVLMIM